MARPTRSSARHEAAHALVAIRTELPLEYVTLQDSGAKLDKLDALEYESEGFVKINTRSIAQWFGALPDPAAHVKIENLAVMTAAGIGAEMGSHRADWRDGANRGDLRNLIKILSHLRAAGVVPDSPSFQGVTSTADPAVQDYIRLTIDRALTLLMLGGGIAWERLATALLRKRRLTAAEVRAVVTESDAEQGKRDT